LVSDHWFCKKESDQGLFLDGNGCGSPLDKEKRVVVALIEGYVQGPPVENYYLCITMSTTNLKSKVIATLKRRKVTTIKALATEVGAQPSYIRKVIGPMVVSSVNRNREGIALRSWIERNADRDGFYTSKVGYIFHICGDIDHALMYLIRNSSFAITVKYANQLTGRTDCKRVLERICEKYPRTYLKCKMGSHEVYYHWKKRTMQLRNAIGMRKIELELPERDSNWIVDLEEVGEALHDVLIESQLDIGPDGRTYSAFTKLCTLIVQTLKMESLRGIEAILSLDQRIRRVCKVEERGVLSPSDLCRYMQALDPDQLEELFNLLVRKLIRAEEIELRYLVVDSSHVLAWHNQKRPVTQKPFPPEYAESAYHVNWYVGYKVHILVDAYSELPIAWKLTAGTAHDSKILPDLIQKAKGNLGISDWKTEAVFGDAGYHSRKLQELVDDQLDCELFTKANPRNSPLLKKTMKEIKRMFDENPGIETVEEALKLFPQKLLDDWGFIDEPSKGNLERQSELIRYMKARLNVGVRVIVERVFSRLKAFTRLERPMMRNWESVQKHTCLCLISMLLVALVAVRKGKPQNKLRMARVI
jgi:hypothetical protein